MKKNISIRKKKNSRGVAVIFTLGILGLLTVMALGFASTALLNRKIADNTSSAEYARHIAKNVALARAKNAVMQNVIISNCYSTSLSSYSDENGKTSQDFLYKMDTVLDGVELYRVTNDSGSIQNNTARWQYVTDPSDNNRILGRYAYAIVPDSGHLDPVGNRGQTSKPGRYGFSEKEIGVYSLCNGDTGLNKNADDDGVAGLKFRTFKEFVSAFQNLSANNKKNFLKDGYRIQLDSTPDAFWIDDDKDGKKTKDELYLRFNMPAADADWESMTVAKLIGEGAGETDSDIKYTSTTKNSVDFIPWLKYWTYSNGSTWTADLMKKQIAANILQYNLPGPDAEAPKTPHKTISDQPDSDWLTSPPTYAGIGRHPMLNEIGFLIRVSTDVSFGTVTESDDKTKITATYTPTFYITVDVGAELIYPFGPASELDKNVEISFSGKSHTHDKVTVNDAILAFELRKFRTASKPNTEHNAQNTVTSLGVNLFQPANILNQEMFHSDLDHISIRANGNFKNHITSASTNIVWENDDSQDFKLTFEPSDWKNESGKPVYTLASKFWKQSKTHKQYKLKCTMATRTLTITTPKNGKGELSDEAEYIAKAIARRMTIDWKAFTPGTVVLKYGGEQRDVVYELEDKTPSNSYAGEGISGWYDMAGEGDSPEKIWFISYEAKDPLVNHYKSDWKTSVASPEVQNITAAEEGKLTSAGYYPGTLSESNGSETATSHLNSTVKDSSGNPAALLKDKEMKADGSGLEDVTLESATDPACSTTSRLSSSYIRHAPMKSFWELGFISRAEAFKTLNLGRVRVFEPGTAYTARGGGTFAQGDANILDQIKFSDTTDQKDAQGKIDLNARYHKVFEWVFNQDVATSGGTTVNWFTNLITGSAVDPYDATIVAGTTRNVVCGNSSSCLSEQHSDSCTETCVAHLLLERSMILPFRNRSDLLLDPDSTDSDFTKIPGYSDLSSDARTKLTSIQRKLRRALFYPGLSGTPDDNANSKLVREQYATRFMNLFKADDNDEHVYIIVLAQSIKDVGGAPAFVDWNGDGEYSSSALTVPGSDNEKMKKFLRTGYIRKKLYDSSNYEKIGSVASVDETITSTAVGTYNYGADKITGETKLIAEMAKDSNTGKWKLVGYRYVYVE